MSAKPHTRGIRAALVGILVNLGLAIVKIAAGVLGHSNALIADGIESAADILSSLLVVGGLHWSAQPADEGHPYGQPASPRRRLDRMAKPS
jgi:divalent metal cation (Fe/Co/Zn/Cd) transporter